LHGRAAGGRVLPGGVGPGPAASGPGPRCPPQRPGGDPAGAVIRPGGRHPARHTRGPAPRRPSQRPGVEPSAQVSSPVPMRSLGPNAFAARLPIVRPDRTVGDPRPPWEGTIPLTRSASANSPMPGRKTVRWERTHDRSCGRKRGMSAIWLSLPP
jgi:hypothetical protein